MDKQQIIAFIEGQLATGKISRDDLISLAGNQIPQPQIQVPIQTQTTINPTNLNITSNTVTKDETPRNLIHILYGIGAIIVVIGVAVLVIQNWDDIGFMGRILVTLGISVTTYLAGLLMNNREQKSISQVMFIISAVLAPLGTFILLNEAKIDFTYKIQIITSIILFVMYGTALLITKRNILVLISAWYFSWAYYAFIIELLDITNNGDYLLKISTLALGFAYLFVGYGYTALFHSEDEQDKKEHASIQNVLYGLGTLAILGSSLVIGGVFDVILIGFIFGAFYGSIYLKSRSMLSLGAVFLIAHIIKLTSKYFVNSVGWPISLIATGFLIIGVGYVTFYLNKKFISGK